MYAYDSAAVRKSEGISEIFDCLKGVKQGCPLSATLFGLLVDGFEQHLMDTVGHDAPSLSGVLIPLLLCADDLIIMSATAAGLQEQLDALQQFCHQRQLSVNLAKTKVVTFGSKAACQTFMFNSNEVERVSHTSILGFEFHATNWHTASHSLSLLQRKQINRRCALLPISDPELRCKLFDSLVLPILSYTSEVWGVDKKIGDAAELLHRQFLKHLLGFRDSTANVIVLAELGRFPLCFHWWQQILRYHNRINNPSDDERLIKCAFVEGMHDPAHLFWSHKVHTWLQGQPVVLSIEDDLDVGTVIGNINTHYAQTWHQIDLSSVARYQPLQPEYVLAPYLSTVKGFKSRKLISRFRCGCHGLHVDTGRLLPLAQQVPREQHHCGFWASVLAGDEHHFVFVNLFLMAQYAGQSNIVRNKFTNIFWGPAPHCLPLLYMIPKS